MIDLDALHPDNLDDDEIRAGVSLETYAKVYAVARDAVFAHRLAREEVERLDRTIDGLNEQVDQLSRRLRATKPLVREAMAARNAKNKATIKALQTDLGIWTVDE